MRSPSLAEETLEDRRLALALGGAVLTAVAALLLGNVAKHGLYVAAAAGTSRFVAGGALDTLTHGFTSLLS